MTENTIFVVNKSRTDIGCDLDKMIEQMNVFAKTIFAPVWGVSATLIRAKEVIPGQWSMILFDDADAEEALGYHDVSKDGAPIGKVFVRTTLEDKELVSVTFCHELCEQLIDPGCQLWAMNGDALYAYEVCDACEEETFDLGGITMSDFLFPAFFEPWHKPHSAKFDYLGRVSKPFETLKGGYQIVWQHGKTKEVFGSAHREQAVKKRDKRLRRSSHYMVNTR
jgi:hypothetical protein